MKTIAALALATLLTCGCASNRGVEPQIYDFGIAGSPVAEPANSLLVADVRAPEWLDTTDMLYRLAYHDPRSLAPYTQSRWAGSPAAMLSVRLRQELGSGGPGAKCALTLQLTEFSQVFDSAASSRAVLYANAVLIGGEKREPLMQREFRLEKPASTADAAGGAAAFSALATDLARALNDWISGNAACKTGG